MCDAEKMYTSGDVARKVGVSITTVKKWEERGILLPDRKLPSGRRLYLEQTVTNFLSTLKNNMKEIKENANN